MSRGGDVIVIVIIWGFFLWWFYNYGPAMFAVDFIDGFLASIISFLW
ncbi:MAG: hypothetical protein AAB596_01360 [Patescibacteria group bacterium]